jgi:hypothetical protein
MGTDVNTSARRMRMRNAGWMVVGILAAMAPVRAADLTYKERFGKLLIDCAPGLLASFDEKTGHFGKGVWICRDQDDMYPLAVVYSLNRPDNRYHKDPRLLEVLMKAGDALIADADPQGRWMFRKKDNSTWGMIHMPWTYSRWIRTFGLIREAMPPDRRAAWEKALLNGYENISKSCLGSLVNIPTHHAMGLYIAGRTLQRPDWCEQASGFLHRLADHQSPNGYWSEGEGPVVAYNYVYVDALGTYYALSRDESIRPALARASAFHRHFTYPDGNCVETIDQRNPFHPGVNQANVGFTFDPVGRAYLASQWARVKEVELKPDLLASLLLYGQEGSIDEPDANAVHTFVLSENSADLAMTRRQGPWFICVSAFTATISKSRWIQDRQNLVSIYHDKTGLLIGGGNTKLQSAWSNFTVGDPSLLAHQPKDAAPIFVPRGELYHVPSAARLIRKPSPGLDLTYGPETCRIRVEIKDNHTLTYDVSSTAASKLPVIARLTLLPRMDQTFTTAAGHEFKLTAKPISLGPDELGGSLRYAGCELALPAVAGLHWPALPHNPYVKDGHAGPEQGRIEIRMPFESGRSEYRVTLTVK